MSIRFSLLLVVAGAALAFLVDYESQGVSMQTLGIIFVVGGVAGFLFAIGSRLIKGTSKQPDPPLQTGASEDRREAVIRDRS